jgi:hypothetical protein
VPASSRRLALARRSRKTNTSFIYRANDQRDTIADEISPLAAATNYNFIRRAGRSDTAQMSSSRPAASYYFRSRKRPAAAGSSWRAVLTTTTLTLRTASKTIACTLVPARPLAGGHH